MLSRQSPIMSLMLQLRIWWSVHLPSMDLSGESGQSSSHVNNRIGSIISSFLKL